MPFLRTARPKRSPQHAAFGPFGDARENTINFDAHPRRALFAGRRAAQPAEPVKVERTETVSATVESIDLDKRLVELRAGDRSTTVQVSPDVRNLAQVKVGDEVVVEYYQGLAAELRKKGESQTVGTVDATTGTARMPEGGQPGAAVGNMVTTTVVIEGVDRSTNRSRS